MQIINANANRALASYNNDYYCVGFVTGPIRAIGGVAQLAINAVATVFSALPTAIGCFKKDSPFHATALLKDTFVGGLHIIRGLIEFLPGSSLILNSAPDGLVSNLEDDKPFNTYYTYKVAPVASLV